MGDVKHTPGPWYVAECQISEYGDGVTDYYCRVNPESDDSYEAAICEMDRIEYDNRANANLIALTPTMYDALIEIRSQCAGHADEFSRRVWAIANGALALTEGQGRTVAAGESKDVPK
jgi:hypothetical protein